MLFCIFISGIRSALLAFIVSIIAGSCFLVFLRVITFFQGKIKRVLWKTTLVIIVTVLGFTSLLWDSGIAPKTFSMLKTYYQHSDFNKPNSISERLGLWKSSYELVKENRYHGVGLGNWRIHFARVGTSSTSARYGQVHFQRPHNDYLWILAEAGIVGLLSFLFVISSFIFYLIRIYLKCPEHRWKVIGLMMIATAYLVDSFFSFPKERITNSLYFFLCLSCGAVLYRDTLSKKQLKPLNNVPVNLLIGILLTIPLLWCVHCSWQRILAEKAIRQGIEYSQQKNWQGAVEQFTYAIKKGYQLSPFSASVHWYRGNALQQLHQSDAAMRDFLTAYHQHPYNLLHLNDLGSCAAKLQKHELAISYYKKALEVSPEYEVSLANLAAEYANSSQYFLAKEIYSNLIKKVPSHAEQYNNYIKSIQQLEQGHRISSQVK